jgi:hypothetical protein
MELQSDYTYLYDRTQKVILGHLVRSSIPLWKKKCFILPRSKSPFFERPIKDLFSIEYLRNTIYPALSKSAGGTSRNYC